MTLQLKLLQPPPFEPEDELNDLVLNGEKELLNNPVQTLAELFPSPDTSRVYIYAILQDVQPPGLIDRELEHLRKHLAVKLPGLRTERIGEDALAANDIQYKSVDTLPDALAGADKEEALDFFHQLNRKIPVFKARDSRLRNSVTHGRGHQNHPILPYHLIRILRVCLGDRFDDHFEELIGPQPGDVASSAKLASFVTAATRHSEKEHQFTGNFSALAKEACLTAVVIDPALDRFGTPYNRYAKTDFAYMLSHAVILGVTMPVILSWKMKSRDSSNGPHAMVSSFVTSFAGSDLGSYMGR
ncbi:hypothetical protein FRB95_009471 [Tulasnella sp. JGI-2019a]|nr:hypothetical protein FRB95_009471 [Tulasnella sp. JGI-2019a]